MIETCPECGQPDNCGDCTHEAAPQLLQKGDRIELLEMGLESDGRPDPDPIPPGAKGTVRSVNESAFLGCTQIGVDWDNGRRRLLLVVPPDRYRIIERVMD